MSKIILCFYCLFNTPGVHDMIRNAGAGTDGRSFHWSLPPQQADVKQQNTIETLLQKTKNCK